MAGIYNDILYQPKYYSNPIYAHVRNDKILGQKNVFNVSPPQFLSCNGNNSYDLDSTPVDALTAAIFPKKLRFIGDNSYDDFLYNKFNRGLVRHDSISDLSGNYIYMQQGFYVNIYSVVYDIASGKYTEGINYSPGVNIAINSSTGSLFPDLPLIVLFTFKVLILALNILV